MVIFSSKKKSMVISDAYIRLAAFHGSSCVTVEKDIVTTPTRTARYLTLNRP